MSHKNPNHNEVKNTANFKHSSHYNKSCHNLAKAEFKETHGRNATADDAQELGNIFEKQFSNYYDKPQNETPSGNYTDYSGLAYEGVADDL